MELLAIDPGTIESGWVLVDTDKPEILNFGIDHNEIICLRLQSPEKPEHVAIEKIATYGMAVGEKVFETCVWTGQMMRAYGDAEVQVQRVTRLVRSEIKLTLCHRTVSIGNPEIRQRLIDLWGEPGKKKTPGPTYGLTNHAWSALAVASTWMILNNAKGAAQWQR